MSKKLKIGVLIISVILTLVLIPFIKIGVEQIYNTITYDIKEDLESSYSIKLPKDVDITELAEDRGFVGDSERIIKIKPGDKSLENTDLDRDAKNEEINHWQKSVIELVINSLGSDLNADKLEYIKTIEDNENVIVIAYSDIDDSYYLFESTR